MLQAKLEHLLEVYPPEDIESRRFEKIAAALGNRTVKQVREFNCNSYRIYNCKAVHHTAMLYCMNPRGGNSCCKETIQYVCVVKKYCLKYWRGC